MTYNVLSGTLNPTHSLSRILLKCFLDMLRDSHILLKWFQRQLEPYRNLVKVIDLTSSWRNGLALCSLIHFYRPTLLYDDCFSASL